MKIALMKKGSNGGGFTLPYGRSRIMRLYPTRQVNEVGYGELFGTTGQQGAARNQYDRAPGPALVELVDKA